jgi:uncharacterized protein YqkB
LFVRDRSNNSGCSCNQSGIFTVKLVFLTSPLLLFLGTCLSIATGSETLLYAVVTHSKTFTEVMILGQSFLSGSLNSIA